MRCQVVLVPFACALAGSVNASAGNPTISPEYPASDAVAGDRGGVRV